MWVNPLNLEYEVKKGTEGLSFEQFSRVVEKYSLHLPFFR